MGWGVHHDPSPAPTAAPSKPRASSGDDDETADSASVRTAAIVMLAIIGLVMALIGYWQCARRRAQQSAEGGFGFGSPDPYRNTNAMVEMQGFGSSPSYI